MNYLIGLVVLAALVIGGWYIFATQQGPLPEETTDRDHVEEEHEEAATNTSQGGGAIDVSGALSIDPNARVIAVGGKNFEFDVKEIKVKEGETVTINFTSEGGFHDWVVDEFDAATDRVNTGGSSSVTFVADKKGTFEFYCSVGNHRAEGMMGTLIVE